MISHYFIEEQKVRQPWIYFLLIAVFGLWMWQLVQQVIMGIPFGTNPAPDAMILVIGVIPLGAFALIFSFKLETVVTKDSFQYRMWPLQKKMREIKPGEIAHWEVKKYNPLRDYGGWGIRIGWGNKGMAYNVSGNMGAYFELKNGKKVLIGTRKPEELRSSIRKMMSREDGVS